MEDINNSMSSPPPTYNLYASEEEGYYDPRAGESADLLFPQKLIFLPEPY
jgi:hypothetical protein